MIDYVSQAAMLEGDALVRHHPVNATLELAADCHIRRIGAMIINACVALLIHADAQRRFSGTGDEDA